MNDRTLESIYARHRQALFALALSTTADVAAAEDAVHDAFGRLVRRGLERVQDPVTYVFAAVRNAALDHVRRSRVGQDVSALSLFETPECGPEQGAMFAERDRLVAQAIDTLPPEQREAIVLRVYANLSLAQTAHVVGAPLQTVATRYRRALERLRALLEKLV